MKDIIYIGKELNKYQVKEDITLKGGLDYDSILKDIPLKAIMNNVRVRNELVKRDKHKEELIENSIIGKVGVSYGLLVGLVHPIVMNKVKAISKNNGLKGFAPIQVHIVLSCWITFNIHKGYFKISQVLKYKGADYTKIKLEVSNLEKLGLIEQLSAEQLYNLTGKVSHGNFARRPNYYKFTRNGERLMLDYLLLYKDAHKQLTGNFWVDDLKKLKDI